MSDDLTGRINGWHCKPSPIERQEKLRERNIPAEPVESGAQALIARHHWFDPSTNDRAWWVSRVVLSAANYPELRAALSEAREALKRIAAADDRPVVAGYRHVRVLKSIARAALDHARPEDDTE